jgi:secondary thiamine-phosphate synthase enzyme
MFQTGITLRPHSRGFHLITSEIEESLPELPECGLLHLFIKHTSAALSLNENADPDVQTDLEAAFNHIVREREPYYQHTCEGDDDMPAHIKSTMIGASVTIPISHHHLNLGTWQGIYLCEFRNRASGRHIVATIIS